MFGGFGISFSAARQGFVSPESFGLMESIMVLCMVVLGGMGHVAGVVLGLGALFGWNQWNRYQERKAEEASAVYETFLQSVRAKQFEQAEAGMATLAADFGSSPYADQGRLAMAPPPTSSATSPACGWPACSSSRKSTPRR